LQNTLGKIIQKFDSNGTFITMWGKEGSKKGQFVHQHDITVDSQDNIYVTDGRQNSRISVFDNDGNFIRHWGSEGKCEGQFIEDHVLL
jgi:DNA-binding beta-propeller fold protein YncE